MQKPNGRANMGSDIYQMRVARFHSSVLGKAGGDFPTIGGEDWGGQQKAWRKGKKNEELVLSATFSRGGDEDRNKHGGWERRVK